MPIRQPIISILGHVDHGKCVVPETLIPLTNGELLTAKEIFDKYSKGGIEREVDDGIAIEIKDGPEIFTFNGKKSIKKRISHLWKLFSPKRLVSVKLRSGDEITTTPEHPFMVLDNDLEIRYKKAKDIEKGEFIIVPRKLNFASNMDKAKEYIINALENAENFVVFLNEPRSENFFRKLQKDTLQNLQKKGLFTTHAYSCKQHKRLRAKDFVKLARYAGFNTLEMYDLIGKIKNSTQKWRAGHTSNPITLPKTESDFKKLGYVLGCMAGDGYVKEGILNNNDTDVQRVYIEYIKDIFGITGKVIQGHTCQIIRTNGGDTYSRFLIDIIGFPRENKSATVSLPHVAKISRHIFNGFLEGWFDTDGYVSPLNNSIEITSKSAFIVKQVGCMLLSYGIHSTIYEKNSYYTLKIANKEYLERFVHIFNPKLKRKKQRILEALKKGTTSRVFDLTPLSGSAFNELKINCSNEDISYFNRYKQYSLLSRAFLEQVIKHAKKRGNLSKIKKVLNEDISYVEVSSTKITDKKSEYVYDFTIQNTHNFVAERMFIHNTTLLDYIRTSRVAVGEAGGITQHIGASEVPVENILRTCNSFLKKWKIDVKIPGLLFIDTPGHAAFSLLRKRGGALADIAILVVDVTEGIKPQTDEAIKILRDNKTPFVIAANKVDKISGWQAQKDACFHDAFDAQPTKIQEELDLKIYKLIGQLGERSVMSDRFDRITDFTKTIAIVPVSGRSGEGVADLLGLITGLSQRYLEKKLALDESGVGKGTVLEVKEVKGLGMTLDIILYDGIMRQGDVLVIGAREKPIVTRVKAILKTPPLKEIRVEKKFVPVKEVSAAAGIKVSAMNIDDVIAGVPVFVLREGAVTKEYEDLVKKEIESVEILTSNEGLIIKADALGSLEAIVRSIKEKNIPIRKAIIGAVSRKDILEVKDCDPKYRVVLAFNANVADDAKQESKDTGVKILESDIIYRLLEGYDEYMKDLDAAQKKALSESLKKPAKVRIIPGFIFRQSKPAVVGMEIVLGTLKKDAKLMNSSGEILGTVEQVQDKNVNIDEGKIGMKCAVSVDGFVIGRNAKENEVFYTFLTKEEYKSLRKNIGFLSQSEITCLDEIKSVMLKTDKLWDLDI